MADHPTFYVSPAVTVLPRDEQYSASEPTLRSDGRALQAGERWYDDTNKVWNYWNGSAWVPESVSGSGFVLLDGSEPMTGDLDCDGNAIVNLADPSDDQEAATKKYVDDAIAAAIAAL
jgi:hypothetical protein